MAPWTTTADSRMASILADIDAAIDGYATAETRANREANLSVVERPFNVNTPHESPLSASRTLSDEVAAERSLAASNRDVRERQRHKNAAEQPDNRSLGVALAAEYRSRLCWFIGTSAMSTQDPDSLTYEGYCGLREKPFSLSSDPRFFFSKSSHGVAFDTLAAGIRRREGILALTGEVGTGKTTLCRAVLHSLNQKAFAAFVPDPFLSREDLLKTLLIDFGLVSADDIRAGRLRGASRTDLSHPLYDFLESLQPLKAFVVLMIDEAQNLTSDLLEEIRILSDLENRQKLLEVVLVGQPELQSRLNTPEMRQLSQRVTVRYELSPLALEDVQPYVSHRLTVAGNDGRVQFTEVAVELVFAASQGIPRVINLICDRALWRAASSRTTKVDADHIWWAVGDLKLPVARTLRPSLRNHPGEDSESSSEGFREVSAPEPEKVQQQAPQADGLLPISVPLVHKAGVATEDLGSSRRAVSSTELSNNPDEGRETDSPNTEVPCPAMDEDLAASGWRRRRWRAPVGASLVLAMGFAGYWSWTAPELLPVHKVAPNVSALDARAEVGLTAPDGQLESPQDSAAAPGLMLQMATFQSAARAAQALKAFHDAGYRAVSREVSLRDGGRALAVFLGPYAERASAERDLDRARQIPGYGSGRVVQMAAAPSNQEIDPSHLR